MAQEDHTQEDTTKVDAALLTTTKATTPMSVLATPTRTAVTRLAQSQPTSIFHPTIIHSEATAMIPPDPSRHLVALHRHSLEPQDQDIATDPCHLQGVHPCQDPMDPTITSTLIQLIICPAVVMSALRKP